MQASDPKKEILEKIKASLRERGDKTTGVLKPPLTNSSSFLPPIEDMLEFVFARNLITVKGKFSFCEDKKELLSALATLYQEQKWDGVYAPEKEIKLYLDMAGIPNHDDPTRVHDAHAGITGCEYLVARSGSIVVSSAQTLSRRVFSHVPQHVVIAGTSQLVAEMKDAIKGIRKKYGRLPGMVTAITGPSRTADIEKTLVLGAHGPEELYVFLVNDK
jgi:L-lactate dehydrogenase complex protein LldG